MCSIFPIFRKMLHGWRGLPAGRCVSRVTQAQCWTRINRTSKVQTQRRHLHAQWTYLLDYSWLYKDSGNSKNPLMAGRNKSGLIESDTTCEDPEARTVLFLHDAFADKCMGKKVATEIINKVWDTRTRSGVAVPQVQALLVNIRGSGESSSDDYDNPHSLANAAEDVLTVVQALCTGPVCSPSVVVAYGTLGKALAHFYVQATTSKGGVTRSTHSEVSGEGAVTPPELVVLLPVITSIGDASSDGGPVGAKSSAYSFEEDVTRELLKSAREYLRDVESQRESIDALVTTLIASDIETADSTAIVAVLHHVNVTMF